jgi:hypothetical protein
VLVVVVVAAAASPLGGGAPKLKPPNTGDCAAVVGTALDGASTPNLNCGAGDAAAPLLLPPPGVFACSISLATALFALLIAA